MKVRKSIFSLVTSAFAISILTAVFLLQGRAYREGWLSHFGLDSAHFPISLTDTYWLALHGWLDAALAGVRGSWEMYVEYLRKLWIPVVIFTFLAITWMSRGSRADDDSEVVEGAEWKKTVRELLIKGGLSGLGSRVIFSFTVGPVSLGATPLLMFSISLLFVVVIAAAVAPFEKAGEKAAIEFCARPADVAAKVFLVDPVTPKWGYRIECNSSVCAMLQDGNVVIVPMSDVMRIEIPSATVAPDGKGNHASVHDGFVPLCASSVKSDS